MIDALVWVIGIPIIIVLAIQIVRKVIVLKAAIREHFEEEATGVKDPYAQMAALANVQQALDEERKRSREAKQLMRLGNKGKGKARSDAGTNKP